MAGTDDQVERFLQAMAEELAIPESRYEQAEEAIGLSATGFIGLKARFAILIRPFTCRDRFDSELQSGR